MKPRALIAEDEPLLAQSLKAALASAWPELEIVALAPNGLEALAAAERLQPDVAFLDIRMPGLDGLEVAAELADRLGEAVPAIVFVTAHDEYALKAFDHAAVDYILKPVNSGRLARAVGRLRERLASCRPEGHLATLIAQLQQAIAADAPPRAREPLRVIRAGAGNTVKMIPVNDVCYFQAADKYTTVVTRDGDALIRTSLRELLAQLSPERFQQIHRGTVVNLEEVAAAVRDDAGRVTIALKHRRETLPVSRVFADLFRQM
ncbi:MAG: response regulator transcription factor [Burkholderiales bacterium]|nr:response regulator transcription factor [Burkholderiales bacterium]